MFEIGGMPTVLPFHRAVVETRLHLRRRHVCIPGG